MRESTTRYVLLGVLAMNEAMTGFEIRAYLDASVQFFWRESFGQIYPELKRLSAEGLIKRASNRGRTRDAQPWRITPAGRMALRAWLDLPAQEQAVRDETLLKMFFSRHASPGQARSLIASRRERAVARLAALEEAEKLVLGEPEDPDLLSSFLVLDRGLGVAKGVLDWCERAEALCDAWEKGGRDALVRQWRRGR
jgi:DNA-binding PadR family transcriptional regulator